MKSIEEAVSEYNTHRRNMIKAFMKLNYRIKKGDIDLLLFGDYLACKKTIKKELQYMDRILRRILSRTENYIKEDITKVSKEEE